MYLLNMNTVMLIKKCITVILQNPLPFEHWYSFARNK